MNDRECWAASGGEAHYGQWPHAAAYRRAATFRLSDIVVIKAVIALLTRGWTIASTLFPE